MTNKLVWTAVKWDDDNPALKDILCYHAPAPGGYYRAAPVHYHGRGTLRGEYIGYEAFFVPDGAKSAADLRDIAENLTSINQAKKVAEADYAAQAGRGGATFTKSFSGGAAARRGNGAMTNLLLPLTFIFVVAAACVYTLLALSMSGMLN